MARLPSNVLAVLGVVLLYRIATDMGPLVILLTLSEKLSLEVASLALAGWTLAGALGQSIWISVARRFALRWILLGLGLVTFIGHTSIGIVDGAAAEVAASTIAGASLPPITAHARAFLVHMLDESRLAAVFDVEAALGSAAFIVAPLAIAITSLVGTLAPSIFCAGLLACVSVCFARIGKGVEQDFNVKKDGLESKTLMRTSWKTIALLTSGATANAMLACVEVVAIARVADRTSTALILSAWAATSFFGGVYLSRFESADRYRFALLPVPAEACIAMAETVMSHLYLFVVVLVLSGFSIAPTLALLAREVARVTPPSQRARTYGWLQASSWIGYAAGNAVAGAMVNNSLVVLLYLAAGLALISVVLILICLHKNGSREAKSS